jgi:hypothetical protein
MVYRTFQGKEIDMEKLMRQNELTQAAGNVKMNARGDQLGSGGKIVKKREDVLAEYYENNPKANAKPPVSNKVSTAELTVTDNSAKPKKSKTED